MMHEQNMMNLNGVDIGISKIELNRSELLVIDKSCKYFLKVYVMYDWKYINSIKVGETKDIDFNEYCLSENNESALIWPVKSQVEKISDDSICFHMAFEDLSDSIAYMNKRGCFDVEINSLEVKVLVDYNDCAEGFISYNF